MARNEAPPFELGQTYFQGQTPDLTVGNQICGKTWLFEDINLAIGGSVKPTRTAHYRLMMAVRNVSGGALLPKLIAKLKNDGTGVEFGSQVMGLATVVGEVGFPIDEFLPVAGVAANDIFWICVGGPATVITAAAGDVAISIGSAVIPSTGGKVVDQDTTVITAPGVYNQSAGAIGRAMKTGTAINTDLLIYVTPKYL